MIYPISIIGSSELRKEAVDIDKNYPDLENIIKNMWETMYASDGVGLAAPQIGKSIRLLVIDASPMAEDEPKLEGFKKTFINAHIIEYNEELEFQQEGCLSVPGIYDDIKRPTKIRIEYYDENFEFHDETYDGWAARVIQHEYDHLDGTLFVDKLSPIKKRLLKSKLQAISKGKFTARYRFKLGAKKRA